MPDWVPGLAAAAAPGRGGGGDRVDRRNAGREGDRERADERVARADGVDGGDLETRDGYDAGTGVPSAGRAPAGGCGPQ